MLAETLLSRRNIPVKLVTRFLSVASAILATYAVTASAQCVPCGGCSDPCGSSPTVVSSGCGGAVGCGQGYVVSNGATYSEPIVSSFANSVSVSSMPASETICEPMTSYRVVMKPTYVTESRAVAVQRTRSETRYRTKTVYKTVPVTEENYRTKVVNVPKTETKTVTYTVLVPVRSEKTVELTETVPEWSEEPETYTVRVPTLVDVPEEYTVKVPQLRDETFNYTVNVPYPVVTEKTRTVTNAVPVTKTRTISVYVPKTEMQTVTKDYGHWEEQIVEVAAAPAATNVVYSNGCGSTSGYASSGCGCSSVSYSNGCGTSCGCRSNCGGCASACGGCGSSSYGGCGGGVSYAAPAVATGSACGSAVTTQTKRVWVPNVQTETVPVTTSSQESKVVSYTVFEQQSTQVPYQCTTLEYRSETRTGTKKVVDYVDETRTRMRKQVQYNEEPRTRMRKTLTYKTVSKTETIPYVTYTTEERTKEVSYTYNVPEYTVEPYQTTRYERVAEELVEEYSVNVPYTDTELQSVQVCKMVPTLVEETINPCASAAPATGIINGGTIGCGPSVIQGGGCGSVGGCGAPVMMSAPAPMSGCGGCGAPVSASPCTGC
ncbi:ferredoxin [Neorhodopirellula lusitana]|uniref:ferredoxin n=1 Tax=Neorhodopirellula lusitana TaxID=445327 RepID=UPI003211E896